MATRDLEDRLIDFAVLAIKITEELPSTLTGKHLGSQLIRSGTSSALNYGEAQGGESRKDFIHKIKIVLKELRETYNCVRIIDKSRICGVANENIARALKENNELIAIFVKTAATAQKNLNAEG